MTPKTLGRFCCLSAALLAAGSVWAGNVSPVASLGGNTYSLTVQANNKFTRNTGKLKDEAVAAATEFCTKAGRQLKVVSVKEDKSLLLVGPYAQVTLTFKALGPDDAEAAVTTEAAGKSSATAPLTTAALYEDLLKLDDLRKKGILTDAEFDAEKKKLLARSR